MEPIAVWGHWGAPNPWKVRIILDELNLPYTWHEVELSDVKADLYTQINPNGRLPAIQDPNTEVTLWESGAIILYLIEQYDKDNKLSYPSTAEKYLAQQWLFFQVSGQGPYYGQATWFARFHPEKLPSATNRYVDEIIRVTGVLNTALKGREWLVGDKCTYADLSFVTWAKTGEGLLAQLGRSGELEKFADYKAWMGRLEEREVVKEALARIAEVRKAHGLP